MSDLRDRMARLVADIMWGESGEKPDEQDYYNADLILALVSTSPDSALPDE